MFRNHLVSLKFILLLVSSNYLPLPLFRNCKVCYIWESGSTYCYSLDASTIIILENIIFLVNLFTLGLMKQWQQEDRKELIVNFVEVKEIEVMCTVKHAKWLWCHTLHLLVLCSCFYCYIKVCRMNVSYPNPQEECRCWQSCSVLKETIAKWMSVFSWKMT